jgi:hypothetical protein
MNQLIGRFLRTHRKAVVGLISQAATVAIAWVVLHAELDVDAETSALLAGTVGSVITAKLVSLFPNDQ